MIFEEGLRLDVLVEDSIIICELKVVDEVNPVWEAQVLIHLKLTGKHLGFLINFNVPLIKMVLNESSFKFLFFVSLCLCSKDFLYG